MNDIRITKEETDKTNEFTIEMKSRHVYRHLVVCVYDAIFVHTNNKYDDEC